jgi:hypothetical protein
MEKTHMFYTTGLMEKYGDLYIHQQKNKKNTLVN